MLREIDERKESAPLSLGRENQLVSLRCFPHLERHVVKGDVQETTAARDHLLTVVLRCVHQCAQLCLRCLECAPRLRDARAERTRKERQRDARAAGLNHLLRVRIARECGECGLEVGQGTPLLIEVVAGVAHAEVPEMVALEVLRVRTQKFDCPLVIVPLLDGRCIVVCARQLGVRLRRALLVGEGFERHDDFLEFMIFVPDLALFEQCHRKAFLSQSRWKYYQHNTNTIRLQ